MIGPSKRARLRIGLYPNAVARELQIEQEQVNRRGLQVSFGAITAIMLVSLPFWGSQPPAAYVGVAAWLVGFLAVIQGMRPGGARAREDQRRLKRIRRNSADLRGMFENRKRS